MTRDSGGERAQKTVAELLAEHGGQVGGTPRRRRRRAAEDGDASGGRQPGIADTAPQAIIDRVRAEAPPPGPTSRGGGPANGRSQAGEEPRRGRVGQPRTGPQKLPPRPPQGSGSYPAPGGEDAGRPPLPPRGRGARQQGAQPASPPTSPPTQSSLPPSSTHSTGYGKPVANGFRPPQQPQPPQQPPQNTGSSPMPPGGGAVSGGAGPQPGGPGAQKPNQAQQGPPRDVADRMNATRRVPAPVPPPTKAPAQEGTLAARLDGLDDTDEPDTQQPAQSSTPQQGGPTPRSGAFPMPSRRRRPPRTAPAPPPEPSTEQFPAVAENDAEKTALAEPVHPDEPPAGLSSWPGGRGGDGKTGRPTDSPESANEATQVGVAAVLESDSDDDDGADTGYYVPDFDDDEDDFDGPSNRTGVLSDDPLGEDDDDSLGDYGTRYAAYGDDLYADSYADDYDYGDADSDERADDSEDGEGGENDENDDEPAPRKRRFGRARKADTADAADTSDAAEDDADDVDGSPAKQWLVLAGQLALGVAGGAGVWLGFNWLWGRLPAAALIAALVVTVGLVWVVRKVRRAEDTQTTVLALLVGLVVTVSPAALLLVSR